MSKQEQLAEAILGRDAQEFCGSELGQYVLGRAKKEAEEAATELAEASPWRIFKGFELRNRIWRAQSMRTWLAELIIDGQNAEKALEYES